MRWHHVFRPAYRHRGKALGIDPEVSYQQWMISLFGKRRAFEFHDQLRAELAAMTTPAEPLIDPGETDYPEFTKAEVAVIEDASYGHSQAETAKHLGKSRETVRRQIRTASNRIGARNLPHLIALAIRSSQILSQQRPKGLRARRKLLAAMSAVELDWERGEQVARRHERPDRQAE